LSIIGSAVGGAFLATRGGKKEAPAAPTSSVLQKVKDAVPLHAGSSEEEQFIRKFIAEAEKEAGGSGH